MSGGFAERIPDSVRHKIEEAEEEQEEALKDARRSANEALSKRFGSSYAEIATEDEPPPEIHPDQLGLLGEGADDRAARERDIARVETHTDDEWRALALVTAEKVAVGMATFTSDDLWLAGLPTPREPRALGPIMREIVKRGWAEITNDYKPSVRRHSTPLRVYRSMTHGA